MRLFIDLDSRRLIVSPALTQSFDRLDLTRGDTLPLEIQFVRDGAVEELTGATGKIGLKLTYASTDFLAYVGSWTQSGSGATAVYKASLSLNTAAIEAEFAANPESISALFEVEWTVSGTITSLAPTTATIANAVIRGGEGDPIANATPSAFRLMSTGNGSVWEFTPDDFGVLQGTLIAGATVAPTAIPLRSTGGIPYTLTVTDSGVLQTTAA